MHRGGAKHLRVRKTGEEEIWHPARLFNELGMMLVTRLASRYQVSLNCSVSKLLLPWGKICLWWRHMCKLKTKEWPLLFLMKHCSSLVLLGVREKTGCSVLIQAHNPWPKVLRVRKRRTRRVGDRVRPLENSPGWRVLSLMTNSGLSLNSSNLLPSLLDTSSCISTKHFLPWSCSQLYLWLSYPWPSHINLNTQLLASTRTLDRACTSPWRPPSPNLLSCLTTLNCLFPTRELFPEPVQFALFLSFQINFC